ncbi:MAG TPA: biotin/lipoyl-containing protein [Chitinophagales bacterium]|nr:biotin/lipoyl-containing protein [Chitinophagales bacterium]
MYKVKVNEQAEQRIEISSKGISLDGKNIDWDQIEIGKNRFNILKDNRSHTCEVLSADVQKKSFEIKVNGKIFRAEVKDRFDDLLHELGMDKAATHKVNIIKAPMPGLVLKLIVREGDELKAGDSLLILEAMKMENVIKSPGAGRVKMMKVKERDAVEKNQVLIELA